MRGCGISQAVGARLWLALATLAIVSCTPRERAPIEGIVVFDEPLQLVRGERRDSVQRALQVGSDSTFVAFVYEDDCNVVVRLAATGADGGASAEVDNTIYGEALEVAALDVPRNATLTLRLDSGFDADKPCRLRTRLLRYEHRSDSDPPVAARLQALRAWTAATRNGLTREQTIESGFRDMDSALAHLESADGDPWLAAWARLTRADMSNLRNIDFVQASRDARKAAGQFAALGDARNAARSRMRLAAILLDVATDTNARNPTAEEAGREAETLLAALFTESRLSAGERASAMNFAGIHAYNQGRFREAEAHYLRARSAFVAVGDRQGRRMAEQNLGVVSAELGDFVVATQYFDRVVAEIDQIGTAERRVMYLLSAARADTNAGYIDRAIDRLLLARKWNTEQLQSSVHEARLLHALGRAYWARGDLAQASTFFREGLLIRRTLSDPAGVSASLRYAGIMAREAGHIDEAIRLHREAVELSLSPDLRLRGLLDLAYDHAAIPDYPAAIAAAREALALKIVDPEFYKRHETQLALGEFLLEQANPGPAAIIEAQSLAAAPLAAAVRRLDLSMELAARHLLARALVAGAHWAEARTEYERAIALIFRYSSTSTNPELQAYTLAREHATFRGYLDLLMRAAAAHGHGELRTASGEEIEALRMIEWARATGFSRTRAAALDAKSGAQIDALLTQMAGKRVRVAALLERTEDSSRELALMQFEIAQLRAQIDRVRAQAQATGVAASATGAPPFPGLAADVAQWSFALGNRQAYLWVRDRAGIRAAVLPLTSTEMERRLAALGASSRRQAPREFEQALEKFGGAILPADALRAQTTTLEIVAEGRLASLPFAAMGVSGDRAITMISSMFRAAAPAKAGSRALRFVAVAAGGGGMRAADARAMPALGSASVEAHAIATLFDSTGTSPGVKLLAGSNGSAAALASLWRGGVDVLHVATHGLADLRQPMTSLLMLPANDANGNATYLTAGQVQEWRGDADLVYLSACETAVGAARFADGMPGLQRAFLRAGARGVIATLWPVEDVYTGQFATDFYRKYTTGIPASRALAETQRAWMQPVAGLRASEQAHRRMTAWAHAYYTQ